MDSSEKSFGRVQVDPLVADCHSNYTRVQLLLARQVLLSILRVFITSHLSEIVHELRLSLFSNDLLIVGYNFDHQQTGEEGWGLLLALSSYMHSGAAYLHEVWAW